MRVKVSFLEDNSQLLLQDLEEKRTVINLLVKDIRTGAVEILPYGAPGSSTDKKAAAAPGTASEATAGKFQALLQESMVSHARTKQDLAQMGQEVAALLRQQEELRAERDALLQRLGGEEAKTTGTAVSP